jgi:predicted phosphoribosyltransferase
MMEFTMEASKLFQDRYHAGLQLAEVIAQAQPINPIVYGIPRGGVIVAAPIAKKLGCPLDVAIAKKIVLRPNPETAMGAVTADGQGLEMGQRYCNAEEWSQAIQQARNKAEALLLTFAPFRPNLDVTGATAILVDDGIATGATIATIAATMKDRPYKEIWVAAPVSPRHIPSIVKEQIDRAIVLLQPDGFMSVGAFYRNFAEVTTAEALSCFQSANR